LSPARSAPILNEHTRPIGSRRRAGMSVAIIDRGRCPQIAGTRITVYDIVDYERMGWHHTAIAATLRLSSAQVIAALDYIAAHRDEVMAEYQRILERHARGNPPEIEEKWRASHAKLLELRERLRREKAERGVNGAGDRGGR
jgi:uncharacterized protein (DUF433 family)